MLHLWFRMSDLPEIRTISVSDTASAVIIREAMLSRDGLETGGILLGTEYDQRVEVLHAGGPGPNARRGVDFFFRDLEHAQQISDAAWSTDHSQWIGEWHTHLIGSLVPSRTDLSSYRRHLADPELGFVHFIAIVVGLHPRSGITAAAWVVEPDRVRPVAMMPADPCAPNAGTETDPGPESWQERMLQGD
jgi:integrative and conjugative element protein (TIGR02256 family)